MTYLHNNLQLFYLHIHISIGVPLITNIKNETRSVLDAGWKAGSRLHQSIGKDMIQTSLLNQYFVIQPPSLNLSRVGRGGKGAR